MKVSLLAFGITKDILGGRVHEIEWEGESTVGGLLAHLSNQYPKLEGLASMKVAVNQEYVDATHPIKPQDEVVLIPPVSGG